MYETISFCHSTAIYWILCLHQNKPGNLLDAYCTFFFPGGGGLIIKIYLKDKNNPIPNREISYTI